jgi:4-hydroxy-tetrahydrodipicolinate synthase
MKLSGSIVALITPMNDQAEIDYTNLSRLIEHHIESGTDGIVIVGTTGESATLTVDEHLAVIGFAVKEVAGRIPVVAGTGANSTHEAIYLTQQAADLNADAALIVVPYYNKPTQEGLYQHYKSIAETVKIPQYLYNVPGRTVADLENETVYRLSKIDNIFGCKDATGDVDRGRKLVEMCGPDFSVLSGDDATALDLMRHGGRGDISVTANVAPTLMHEMCAAALVGDFDSAEQIDARLRGLHTNLFLESNPIPVKYAVAKQGYTSNTLRLPLTSLQLEHCDAVDRSLGEALSS